MKHFPKIWYTLKTALATTNLSSTVGESATSKAASAKAVGLNDGVPDGINCDDCAVEAMEDREDWECAFPDKCLMPSPDHHRSECYTVEDAEVENA